MNFIRNNLTRVKDLPGMVHSCTKQEIELSGSFCISVLGPYFNLHGNTGDGESVGGSVAPPPVVVCAELLCLELVME